MSKEDDIKAVNQGFAEAARVFGEAASEWSTGWLCEEGAGSLSPVFGVDLNARGDIVYELIVEYPRREVDPMDRLVDGLTVRECLERYTANQRGDTIDSAGRPAIRRRLTPAQRDAARLAWSAELKRKQQEAGEKERRIVVCDDDRWEP